MDFLKIRSLVEQYRDLSGLSSLPFFVKVADQLLLCWFNYDVDQTEALLKVFVQAIYSLEGDRPTAHSMVFHCDFPLHEYTEPALDERAYYDQLQALYTDYSDEAMDQLLTGAEPEPLPQVYRLVAQKIRQEKEA